MNLPLNSVRIQQIIEFRINNVEKLQQAKLVLQFFRHFLQTEGRR
jgi:hypothetical protein